ncbi:MAG TPA: sortase [Candidatus Dormibacteraeota bacterium]|jgi:LPXTG-site transpeptidase (sortase) family protein|nr:sortase [Candidatus Dormibacteraeota bacterium]
MRRGLFVLLAAGVLVVLASTPGAMLVRPAHPVEAPRTVLAITSTTPAPSPTAVSASQLPAAAQPNAVAAIVPPTAVTGRVSIPRIGIRNAPIHDRGTDSKGVMLIAPGYSVTRYAFSAPFGTGNTVLYGHDDIQGNIFGRLYDLKAGDTIQITVGSVVQTYRVTGHQIVLPTEVSVLAPTSDVRLTIITCWPFNVDTKRWIVTAVAG